MALLLIYLIPVVICWGLNLHSAIVHWNERDLSKGELFLGLVLIPMIPVLNIYCSAVQLSNLQRD